MRLVPDVVRAAPVIWDVLIPQRERHLRRRLTVSRDPGWHATTTLLHCNPQRVKQLALQTAAGKGLSWGGCAPFATGCSLRTVPTFAAPPSPAAPRHACRASPAARAESRPRHRTPHHTRPHRRRRARAGRPPRPAVTARPPRCARTQRRCSRMCQTLLASWITRPPAQSLLCTQVV
jgi:hypothetical protein